MNDKQYYIEDMCFFIPFKKLRNTPKVEFDLINGVADGLSSIDRVKHEPRAFSPSVPGSIEWYWYMHPCQEDNLIVFHGKRYVQLYSKKHGKVERFEVTPDYVKHNNKYVYEGRCVFGWSANVFHRVQSPKGSISINFAKHFKGFDLLTNFNIYKLNTANGEFEVVRKGQKDQGCD